MDIAQINNMLKAAGVEGITDHISTVKQYENWFNYSVDPKESELTASEDENGELVGTTRERNRMFLHPQKAVAKTWAQLFFNETTQLFSEQNKEGLTFLTELYAKKRFYPILEKQILEAFGVGTRGICVEYGPHGAEFTSYSAANILPISIENGVITEAAFLSFKFVNGKKYWILSVHLKKEQKEVIADGVNIPAVVIKDSPSYIIKNFAFTESGKPILLTDIGISENSVQYESPARLFAIFKPFNRNFTELECVDNAIGAPIYADCLDTVREIDTLFDQKHVDTVSARRIVFINKFLIPKNGSGKYIVPSWLDNVVVVGAGVNLSADNTGDSKPVEFAPNPRCDVYSNEIQAALNRLSVACGLGTDEFMYGKGGITTATQIVSANQTKFVNLKKHTSAILPELEVLNRAILAVYNLFERKNFNLDGVITFTMQDSVIVDDDTRKKDAIAQYQAGLMSLERFLQEFEGLSGDELTAEIERIKADKQSSLDFTGLFKAKEGSQS